MARVTDAETILDDIAAMLQANLNTKIDAINTEKSDSIVLAHLNSASYIMQSLDTSPSAYDPFLFYTLDDVKSEGIGPATSKEYRMNFVICAADTGQDANIARRMFRYLRALEDTFESYFAGINRGFKMAVESLVPVKFQMLDSSNEYRAAGVTVTVSIA